jgi:hypothetical protein
MTDSNDQTVGGLPLPTARTIFTANGTRLRADDAVTAALQ